MIGTDHTGGEVRRRGREGCRTFPGGLAIEPERQLDDDEDTTSESAGEPS